MLFCTQKKLHSNNHHEQILNEAPECSQYRRTSTTEKKIVYIVSLSINLIYSKPKTFYFPINSSHCLFCELQVCFFLVKNSGLRVNNIFSSTGQIVSSFPNFWSFSLLLFNVMLWLILQHCIWYVYKLLWKHCIILYFIWNSLEFSIIMIIIRLKCLLYSV